MRLTIPASVDVKSLVSRLNLTKTLSRNLKYRIYYILSRIVVHDENLEFYKSNNYYRFISSDTMKKIFGPRYYYQALELLMDPIDPVIECNNSYQTDKFPKAYRMTDKYNTGEVMYRSLPDDLEMVIRMKNSNPYRMEELEMKDSYGFLLNQFEKHKLSFDPSVFKYVQNMYQLLFKRVVRDNEYQKKMIYNLIGRWLNIIDKLNNGDLNPMVSGKNHRLNSLFTQIPKNLRPFILCNGEPLVGLDIKSSQPYLLASVMNDDFFTSGVEGYNLKTIHPSLFKDLYYRNMVDDIWNTGSNINSTGYNNDYVINSTGNTTNNITYYTSTIKYTPFMWCHFLTPHEIENIKSYQSIPFNDDYYSFVLKSNNDSEISPEELSTQRNSFKKSNMYILFDEELERRKNIPQVKYMNKCYPGVNKWLELALEHIGGKEFSYILQRSESYLLLNKVSRQFNKEYMDAPIFTIHDGLYTFQEYIEPLNNLIINTGLSVTRVLPGVKLERPRVNENPSSEDIDEYWKKIKWVTNSKKFEEKKRCVFQSNIDRASKFI